MLQSAQIDPDDEVAQCRQSMEAAAAQDRAEILLRLYHRLAALCRWDEMRHLRSALRTALMAEDADRDGWNGTRIPPRLVLRHLGQDAVYRRCAVGHALALAQQMRSDPLPVLIPDSVGIADGRLRVGYLSGDFHRSSAVHIAALMEHHDRRRVTVTALNYGPVQDTALRRRLQAGADRFVDLPDQDADAARMIRSTGIDLLVDLMGYSQGSRPGILAYRPTALTVRYGGYLGTLGAGFVDYLIADSVLAPAGEERNFAEAVIRLPGCALPGDARRFVGGTPDRLSQGLPESGFVFCCFNAADRITYEILTIWLRLLTKVPGSVLWLGEAVPEAMENLRAVAIAGGVDPARLIFAPRWPEDQDAQHLARLRCADLYLDTMPCAAQTATLDALWAGVPVLTVPGDGMAGRVAATLLTGLGLPELIAPSLADYEAQASRLARDSDRLTALRHRLAQGYRRPGNPFDTAATARRLELAYAEMWRRWSQGVGAIGFTVTEPAIGPTDP